jgi:enoyl-CoA hydratase/carnithine racemase
MSLRIDRSLPDVLVLRLDRPAQRNAINRDMVEALLAAFTTVSERAVVLGSTDPSAFCAGADLTLADAERAAVSDLLYEVYARMIGLDAPIVVAVGGHAVGGGAQLALAGDLRIGTPATRIRFPGPGHGLAVGAWGLPSLVGRGRALDLCLTMRPVDAAEAMAIGLLDRVVDDADAAAMELATTLAGLDPAAVRRTKTLVRDASGLAGALAKEQAGNQAAWSGSTAGLRTGKREPR